MSTPIDNLIRSKRKTVALIIQPDGKLTVRAPLRMSEKQIREFVQIHEGWIHKNQAKMQVSPPPPEKVFRAGESFMYLGNDYPLAIVAHQRPALILADSKFQLSASNLNKARELFNRWYKNQARIVVTRRVIFFAKQYQFKYLKIRISSARTRWGSCSTNGTLSFTWRLVMSPPEVVDYIVLHELVHTQIRNHSKKYWTKLGEILPMYKIRAHWLKENGKYLILNADGT
jgi:predicted metal-dependent hydrolase